MSTEAIVSADVIAEEAPKPTDDPAVETKEAPNPTDAAAVETKEPPKQSKRSLEETEAQLDELLEKEKSSRKKRWLAVIKPLLKSDKEVVLGFDAEDGVGLWVDPEDSAIELAHNNLYYYERGFHSKRRILTKFGVSEESVDDSSNDSSDAE